MWTACRGTAAKGAGVTIQLRKRFIYPWLVFGHRGRVFACAVLLTICAAFTAYYRVFVSLANYDDEG